MKKLASLLLALVMIMSCFSAMAEATSEVTTVDITINDGSIENAVYSAHLLMNAEALNDGSGKYLFTMNEPYKAILQQVTGKTTDAEVATYIAALQGDAVRTFADAVYAKIVEKQIAATATSSANKFEDMTRGYYLIAETVLGDTTNGATDTYSLVMLNTAGVDPELEVTTKESVPSVDKQVEEKNDTTGESSWGEDADYDIGDTISYKITGTVSSQYADYESYYYSFSDTMDNGLTLNQDSIKIMIGEVDVTSQFTIVKADHSFSATANLKELTGVTVTGDTTIVVTYTATLNASAVSGTTGNKNTVHLEYENDPTHNGDGNPSTPDKPDEPGKTPYDTNIVFTFDAIVNKTDDLDKPLVGAGFTLYKWDASVEGEDKWVAVGTEKKAAEGATMTTFTFEGLDVGKYKLVETTVPSGYNKAADIEFEVVATYTYNTVLGYDELTGLEVKDSTGAVISGENLTFTAETANGEVTTTVVNKTGTTLPSTGGMGTTLLYVGGGILVLAAIVLLIAKRRTSAE